MSGWVSGWVYTGGVGQWVGGSVGRCLWTCVPRACQTPTQPPPTHIHTHTHTNSTHTHTYHRSFEIKNVRLLQKMLKQFGAMPGVEPAKHQSNGATLAPTLTLALTLTVTLTVTLTLTLP